MNHPGNPFSSWSPGLSGWNWFSLYFQIFFIVVAGFCYIFLGFPISCSWISRYLSQVFLHFLQWSWIIIGVPIFSCIVLGFPRCVWAFFGFPTCVFLNCVRSGITIIIIAPRLLPFGGRPAVGFGPKLEEMNPRTFPDLPIRPRTLDFDQKTLKSTPNFSTREFEKSKNPLLLPKIPLVNPLVKSSTCVPPPLVGTI